MSTPDSTFGEQLAARAAELLPDMNLQDRLELLGVMTPGEIRESLAWLVHR